MWHSKPSTDGPIDLSWRGPGRRQSVACPLPAYFRERLLGKRTMDQPYPSDTRNPGQGRNSELDLSPRQNHYGGHAGVQQGLWVGFRQTQGAWPEGSL